MLERLAATTSQRLWSSIFNEYKHDSANDIVYRVFAFMEDEQLGKFRKEFDVTTYMKCSWIKANTWFQAIITNYSTKLD
jgi:hypothetical protein